MSGSQKFLSRNRAPRVQIEYDVELYGAQKKVQLPFVMGVMADLSGKSQVPTGSVAERKFLEVDIDNFDSRMKAMKPRAAFSVPNTISGEGNLSVDLVFEKMSDFSPAEIARKVEPLRKLLEARTQLANLMTYMDGKAGAEDLIEKLVANPEQLRALALGAGAADEQKAAFEAMKASAPEGEEAPKDNSAGILEQMAAQTPDEEKPEEDDTAGILADMADAAPIEEEIEDRSADILSAAASEATEAVKADTSVEDALAGLASEAVEPEAIVDDSADILAGLAADSPEDEAPDTSVKDALAGMAEATPEEAEEDSGVDELLSDMADEAPDDEVETDDSGDILADMADTAIEEIPEDDGLDELLADMAEDAPEDEAEDSGVEDLLSGMADATPEEAPEDDGLDDLLADMAEDTPEDEAEESGVDDLLSGMANAAPEPEAEVDVSGDILAELAVAAREEAPEDDGLDDLLADMAEDAPEDEAEGSGLDDLLAGMAEDLDEAAPEDDDLGGLLADMAQPTPAEAPDDGSDDILASLSLEAPDDEEEDDGLEGLLADMAVEGSKDEEDTLADILGDISEGEADDGGLGDLLAGMAESADQTDDEDDDLDALLAGISDDSDDESDDLDSLLASGSDDDDEGNDLDTLLAGAGDDDDDLDALLSGGDDEDDDLDALLAGGDDDLDDLLSATDDELDLDSMLELDSDDEVDDLDDLLAGDDDLAGLDDISLDEEPAPPLKPQKPAFQPDFGAMSAAKLQDEPGARRKFRLAVLGDFSGRGNRGALETGAALGKRKGFKLDFDTMEDVIMRFRTTLTLPLGNDGSAIEVELNELDDLHPDELFENVALFNELNMLRRDLSSGRNFEQNVERMKAWGGEFGDFKALSKKRSKGADAPADLRLSDFQNLIGDDTPKPEASAASELISRIIGPHMVAAADNGAEEMIAAVDRALSTAMSSVLHHPDFQTIEAAWRSIELLGRRVEASAELEVVVYDISVEEFSADLAAQEDMAGSGLYDMLVEKPRQDESAGPISAVVGLYTWEETPTHAELLARMARICAQMDAPFISAISTGFMGVKPEDRHPLVKKTWGALGEMPEAKYLGLASPRFMLRMPYGKKTEPLDRFDYEEFNLKEGMRSMLMANPALLVAVLLAETKAQQGGDMSLGSIMSLNDMPFHFMTDQYGDQVALPCTERLLSVNGAADVIARGFMPVISVQGQNMVKLASFQAVGGGELLGIWAGDAAKDMKSGKMRMETSVGMSSKAKQVGAPPKAAAAGGGDSGGDDDLEFGFDSDVGGDLGGDDDLDLDMDLDLGGDLGGDLDLDMDLGDDGMDDLLAGFDDDDDDDDDDDMDADLAALLGDL